MSLPPPGPEVNNNSNNEYVMSKSIAAIKQQTLRRQSNNYSNAPTHQPGLVLTIYPQSDHPCSSPAKIINENIASENPARKKKSRRDKVIDFPRTSTKKGVIQSPPTDTDSGPENLNADALRARLKSDPRYRSQKLRPRNPSADYILEGQRQYQRNTQQPRPRNFSADYIPNERHEPVPPRRRVEPQNYHGIPDEPPHSNKDSGYSGSVNGLLEQFNNVIPDYPPPPSTGLVDVARLSYSNYIHSAMFHTADDVQTTVDTPTKRAGLSQNQDIMYSGQTTRPPWRDIMHSCISTFTKDVFHENQKRDVQQPNVQARYAWDTPSSNLIHSVYNRRMNYTMPRSDGNSNNAMDLTNHQDVQKSSKDTQPIYPTTETLSNMKSSTSSNRNINHAFPAYVRREHVSCTVSCPKSGTENQVDGRAYVIDHHATDRQQSVQPKHDTHLHTYI